MITCTAFHYSECLVQFESDSENFVWNLANFVNPRSMIARHGDYELILSFTEDDDSVVTIALMCTTSRDVYTRQFRVSSLVESSATINDAIARLLNDVDDAEFIYITDTPRDAVRELHTLIVQRRHCNASYEQWEIKCVYRSVEQAYTIDRTVLGFHTPFAIHDNLHAAILGCVREFVRANVVSTAASQLISAFACTEVQRGEMWTVEVAI